MMVLSLGVVGVAIFLWGVNLAADEARTGAFYIQIHDGTRNVHLTRVCYSPPMVTIDQHGR